MSSADAETAGGTTNSTALGATFARCPLVGRDEELTFLARALGDQRHPGAGAVLAGSVGVGKTRLAREALESARRDGATVRWAVASHAAQAVPLGALSRFLVDDISDPALMLPRAARALSRGPAGGRVVIGVDDAHLLDPASALALHEIVLAGLATVLITVRTGEPAPDAITGLWKDGRLERVEVQALSDTETARLLEAVLGGPVDQVSAERLWRITGGITLYLRHLVDAEREAGRLRCELGVWRWCGEPGLSGTLAHLVEARMGELAPATAEVLDALAFGEPLALSTLRELTGQSAMEEAEARGLIVAEGCGRQVRLAHPLYGEVRRARTGTVRARRLCGRIAEAMADTEDAAPDTELRRAVLVCDSDLPPEPGLLTAGARTALALDDVGLCERLASAAVGAAGGFEARLLRAQALTGSGRAGEALDELIELEDAAIGDDQRMQAAIPHVINLFWGFGRVADAEAALRSAYSAMSGAEARCALTSLSAVLEFCQGRPRQAIAAARSALEDAGASDTVVLQACYALVGAFGLTGRADRADAVAERGVAAAARTHSAVISPVTLRLQHINALAGAGHLRRADELAAIAAEESAAATAQTRVKATLVLGRVRLARGDLAGAVRALREARSGLGADCAFGLDSVCLLTLAQALARLGRGRSAAQMLAETYASRSPALAFLDPELGTVEAWTRAAQGRSAEARDSARQAAALAAERAEFALEVQALQTAVCLGDARCSDHLRTLARVVEGPRVVVAAQHAAALERSDPEGLEAAARGFAEFGDLLSALDASAQAAVAYRRGGNRGAASAAEERARSLAASCGGARTPALALATGPAPAVNIGPGRSTSHADRRALG